MPEKIDSYLNVDLRHIVLRCLGSLSHIRRKKVKGRLPEVRKVPINLLQSIYRTESHFEALMPQLLHGLIEQLNHMVSAGQSRLIESCLCLNIGCPTSLPCKEKPDGTSDDDTVVPNDFTEFNPRHWSMHS